MFASPEDWEAQEREEEDKRAREAKRLADRNELLEREAEKERIRRDEELDEEEKEFLLSSVIVHRGFEYSRVIWNWREKVVADLWEEENEVGKRSTPILRALLEENGIQVSQRDARVAATVIQWLGTNVGYNFLLNLLKAIGYSPQSLFTKFGSGIGEDILAEVLCSEGNDSLKRIARGIVFAQAWCTRNQELWKLHSTKMKRHVEEELEKAFSDKVYAMGRNQNILIPKPPSFLSGDLHF